MTIKPAKDLVADANDKVETISAEQARTLLGQPDVTVVDLREKDEIKKTGKVTGALHVPRGFLEFHADPSSPNHQLGLDPDRKLVLYCGSGSRSALAALTLQEMGFENVVHVAGGFGALEKAGASIDRL